MKDLLLYWLGWGYGFSVALGFANVMDGRPFGAPAWVSLFCSVSLALLIRSMAKTDGAR